MYWYKTSFLGSKLPPTPSQQRYTADFISEYYPIRFAGKGNGWWSTAEGGMVYGESFEGYGCKDRWLWVKGYGGIRWKGLKRRLFALKRHLFSFKRHLFEAKRRLFNCFHPRQTFFSPNDDVPFTCRRHIFHLWHPRIDIGKEQFAARVLGTRSMGSCQSVKD